MAIKEGEDNSKEEDRKVVKHVQEVLFQKKYESVYAKDLTNQPRSVKISLASIQKALLKKQEKVGGVYGELSRQEIKHSKGL